MKAHVPELCLRWRALTDAEVVALVVEQGLSKGEIALRYGICGTTVYQRMRKLGVRFPRPVYGREWERQQLLARYPRCARPSWAR